MAHPQTVEKQIQRLADNYGKRADWVAAVSKPWCNGLEEFPDDVVIRAVAWALETREWCPALAVIRQRCAELHAPPAPTTPRGCGRCARGLRFIAWHHEDARRAVVVEEMVARCTCALGRSQSESIGVVDDVEQRLRCKPSTLEVYVDPTFEQRGLAAPGGAWSRHVAENRARFRAVVGGPDAHAAQRARHLEQERLRDAESAHEGRGFDE